MSSFRIVPTASESPIVAFVALARLTKNVSSGSNSVSPTTGTVSVCDWTRASPGWNVSVPLTAW